MYCPRDGLDDFWASNAEKPKHLMRTANLHKLVAMNPHEELNEKLKQVLAATEQLTLDTNKIDAESLSETPHNKDLPIFKHRESIIDAINNNLVCIISGDTGCGKTTQVPQYILDSYKIRNDDTCNILVSQPRKIAAITLAQRVAEERGSAIGGEIGFQVGLNKSWTKSDENATKVLFCTTGVVLNKLASMKSLARYSHIIIDEVHERDLDTDFLLAIIRRLMPTSPKTKIILMSATINQKDFVDFFRIPNFLEPAVIECRGNRVYPIDVLYIDNYEKALKDTEYFVDTETMNYDQMRISSRLMIHACYVLFVMINTVLKDSKERKDPVCSSTFLIFLPGLVEIEAMYNKIEYYKDSWIQHLELDKHCGPNPVHVIVLHSALSTDSQRLAFESTTGIKIILSTNIAESGVTIPNVKMIFDFCLTRYQQKESSSNLTSLVTDWASLQNLEQRAGRCGRTMKGIVYRLVHKRFFNSCIANKKFKPEMQRTSLENIVLKSKILDLGSPADILALTMNPPARTTINDSILYLKEMGALKRFDDDENMNYEDGEITFVGRIMEGLPIDCHLARLVIFGYILGVYEETLIIAAGLSLKSIFCFAFGSQVKAFGKKLAWADTSECDCTAILNAYSKWERLKKSQQTSKYDNQWCKNNNLERRSLFEIEKLIKEIRTRMDKIGFKNLEKSYAALNVSDRDLMIKIAIAGTFGAPNFFVVRGQRDGEDDAFRAVNFLDVFRSVYFTGMNKDVLSKVYEDQVRESLLEHHVVSTKENVMVKFAGEKVFVTFQENELDFSKRKGCTGDDVDERNKDFGNVPLEVYKAVKLRKYNGTFKIYFTDTATERKYAIKHGLATINDMKKFEMKQNFIKMADRVFLPTKSALSMKGVIKSVGDTGRIYFRPTRVNHFDKSIDDRYKRQTAEFEQLLAGLKLVDCWGKLKEKDQVIYEHDDGTRVRGEIIGSNPYVMHCWDTGENFTPDFSRIKTFEDEATKSMTFNYPPQCFEIQLLETQPSYSASKNHRWSKAAVGVLREHVNQKATISIFSRVNDVVIAELFVNKVCINDQLKELGLAIETEESVLSKLNHMKRMENDVLLQPQDEFDDREEEIFVSASPNKDICHKTHHMKGPYSPLEAKLEGLSRQNQQMATHVQDSSVNQVFLNDDVFENKKKFYVAAHVSLSMGGNLKLDEVSHIPQIPGLAAILAMIFSPIVQLRRNEKKTKYLSILCGLGYDDRARAPILANRDVAMELDIDLTPAHLGKINQIREFFSKFLYTKQDETFPSLNDGEKFKTMQSIRNTLLELIKMPSTPTRNEFPFEYFKWDVDQQQAVVKLHGIYNDGLFCQINEPIIDWRAEESHAELRKHALELQNASQGLVWQQRLRHIQPICRFCNFRWDKTEALRLHLNTSRHNKKVHKLLKQSEIAENLNQA